MSNTHATVSNLLTTCRPATSSGAKSRGNIVPIILSSYLVPLLSRFPVVKSYGQKNQAAKAMLPVCSQSRPLRSLCQWPSSCCRAAPAASQVKQITLGRGGAVIGSFATVHQLLSKRKPLLNKRSFSAVSESFLLILIAISLFRLNLKIFKNVEVV